MTHNHSQNKHLHKCHEVNKHCIRKGRDLLRLGNETSNTLESLLRLCNTATLQFYIAYFASQTNIVNIFFKKTTHTPKNPPNTQKSQTQPTKNPLKPVNKKNSITCLCISSERWDYRSLTSTSQRRDILEDVFVITKHTDVSVRA